MSANPEVVARPEPAARQRILDAAYELFARRGIRAVGIDEVIERAGVAKATLYRHFPSKDDLVVAFLELREQRWTLAWVQAEARRRGTTPEEQLLAIFELFDEWFHRDDFEACSFVNVLLEMGPAHPAGRASIVHLENIRSVVSRLAEEAGLRDPESFARSWHILMKGSIVSAAEGDADAARRAQAIARLLIDEYRPATDTIAPLPSGEMIEAFRSSADFKIHELSGARVRATLTLNAAHHQPFGVVHGGIYALAVEGVASAGACAAVADRGQYAVGTSNTTDFLRPVTEAEVEVVAEPIFQGRTQQLWSVEIRRLEDSKLAAKGQLRLQNLPLPEA